MQMDLLSPQSLVGMNVDSVKHGMNEVQIGINLEWNLCKREIADVYLRAVNQLNL